MELERFKDSLAQYIILHLDLNNFEEITQNKNLFFYFYFRKKYESSHLKTYLNYDELLN
jgi:hypothetical protein